MTLLFFIVISLLMVYACYRLKGELLNVFTILVLPYLLIIPINNWIMVKYKFYMISNRVIWMLFFAFVAFFLGNVLFSEKVSLTQKKSAKDKFKNLDIIKMSKYIILVEIVTVLRILLLIFDKGIGYLGTEEFENWLLSGLLGHFLLTIYPLIPIIFYYWLKNKIKIKYLIISLIGIGLYFMTFVKYHSIGMIVLIYIFVSLEETKYFIKGGLVVLGMVVVLFVGNYFLSFFIRGTNKLVQDSYYFTHLWNYIGGSIIYDNYIFTNGVKVDVNIFYKMGSFCFAVLNWFFSVAFEMPIFPHEALSFKAVGLNGERGNVVDAIGYLYPSKGGAFEVGVFYIIIFIIGVLFDRIYTKSLKNREHFNITLCIFLVFFVFFSFFGTFYINLPPWEILMWSVVMLKIFDKRVKIKINDKLIL